MTPDTLKKAREILEAREFWILSPTVSINHNCDWHGRVWHQAERPRGLDEHPIIHVREVLPYEQAEIDRLRNALKKYEDKYGIQND